MKKHAKTLLLLCVIGIIVVAVFLQCTKPNNNSTSPNTAPTNIQGENNSSSFIESLRSRDYEPSQITIESTLSNNGAYTGYLISYISDGLKIYGRMNVPTRNGLFPVIILNHGYFNQSSFTSGDGTQTMADILARNGYLTLASDYRGFGKSEIDTQGSRGHNPNYAIDILNLIASVTSLDKADLNRIGMWGHSMGGEVAIRTAEATDKIKAVVLWAPTSTKASENAAFYGRGRRTSPLPSQGTESAYSNNDIGYITAPISLHQGLSDTEVDPEWSKDLDEALQKEGKSVEYFEYPGQDHNFRNLGWEVISKRTIEFFDKYLK
ncbi:alpha/beta fold hydrolase [Candidatus Daviesbacteria bacterium]|nr:alpha/beta fold hydrolase [Candidatus Daviesbacteria bacterium]